MDAKAKKLQGILSKVRKSVEKYGMIKYGDSIAVGVSGGKDSLVLLYALAEMRRFDGFSYKVTALTVDNGGEYSPEYSGVTALCRELGVEHRLIETDIAKIVFETRDESSPCSLCAKLRRGALHSEAQRIGCNVLALGHHMDDVAETYMMNIILAGRAGCFNPVMTYEESGLRLIRPLVYLREKEISSFSACAELPVVSKTCPMDGQTEREHMKELLRSEDARHRGVYTRILGALERSRVDGWR